LSPKTKDWDKINRAGPGYTYDWKADKTCLFKVGIHVDIDKTTLKE
jgi:hypothetical protein